MKILLRPLQWIYFFYAATLFIAIMLLIFPFALMAATMGKIRGGQLMFFLCRIWAYSWFSLIFIIPKRKWETRPDKNRSYIFVNNHISYLDAAILPIAYQQKVRALGKIEMAKVPVFGFIYRHAIVTVDRSSAVNRIRSVRILKSLLNKGISIIVFPEGTFNTSKKPLATFYDGAFRIAIETQTPIKPVIFPDAYRRMPFESVFKLNPGLCRIIYLEEIPVTGFTIADTEKLKQQVYSIMEKKLIEYNAAWKGKDGHIS
jgi:1-acyl-sn-glycerol-3-phosphate acyltransferase